MGPYEWSGMAAGPIVLVAYGCFGAYYMKRGKADFHRIYLVRTISSTVFELRIESLSTRLKDQQAERAKTIQKLKDATRYDSTLELLERYGGGEAKPKGKKKNVEDGAENDATKKSPGKRQRQENATPRRTNIPPPATANIQRHGLSNPATPQPAGIEPRNTPQHHVPSPGNGIAAGAEFSPNAFDAARPPRVPGGQYEMAPTGSQNHWYDRIMDLLLGEDETASKNRIVLICKACRLVNGQAPPGTNNLSDLGMWKCMGCGAANGEVDEGKRIVREVLGEDARKSGSTDSARHDEDSSDLAETQSEGVPTEDDVPPNDEEAEEEKAAGVRKRRNKGNK